MCLSCENVIFLFGSNLDMLLIQFRRTTWSVAIRWCWVGHLPEYNRSYILLYRIVSAHFHIPEVFKFSWLSSCIIPFFCVNDTCSLVTCDKAETAEWAEIDAAAWWLAVRVQWSGLSWTQKCLAAFWLVASLVYWTRLLRVVMGVDWHFHAVVTHCEKQQCKQTSQTGTGRKWEELP